jgi:hypothetical protein
LSCNPEGDGQVQADSDAKYQPFLMSILMSILPGFGCPDKVLVFLVQWIGKVYVKQVVARFHLHPSLEGLTLDLSCVIMYHFHRSEWLWARLSD